MPGKSELTLKIKAEAIKLGFDGCGIAKAGYLADEYKHLSDYILEKRNAGMDYLARNVNKRTDPGLILENAKSVISVLLGYYPDKKQNPECRYNISKYAYGQDYHKVIKEKLSLLLSFIKQQQVSTEGIICIDSAPTMDKAWAARAGLGWVGKNTLLLNRKLGSYFFIGEIITDIELNYDITEPGNCGNCTKCIDACPTGALISPYCLDASKCIACATIETKTNPQNINFNHHGWIYGCDICQDICPWNKNIVPSGPPEFGINPFIENATDKQWEDLDEMAFNKIFHNSALMRRGFSRIKQNIELIDN